MADDFRISRRKALAGMATVPLVGFGAKSALAAPAKPSLSPASETLNALALRGGRRFGSAIACTPGFEDAGSIQNPLYAELVKQQCGIIVPENALKMQSLRPDPHTFAFARADQLVAWAKRNGLAIRGHNLIWLRPQWMPRWLNNYDFGADPKTVAERIITTHVRTVTQRYRGTIHSWDVINEAIDHQTHGLMKTSLGDAMGSAEAVIDLAFHTARAELPNAQLVYNDYMSWEPQHLAHCADVLRLLEGLKKRNVPCDALGIQSHIEMMQIDPATGVGPYAETQWRKFLDEVVGMGYRLLITEFDVKDKALPANIKLRDAKVADYARRYFDVMLEYSSHLDDVLAWGLVDRYSWLQHFPPARRKDGLEVRGTPYDNAYKPKPLREAIAASLATVPT